jgi:hypothetical protein
MVDIMPARYDTIRYDPTASYWAKRGPRRNRLAGNLALPRTMRRRHANSYGARFRVASERLDQFLSRNGPDGQFKLLHLWAAKFPQAARLDYASDS